MSYEYLPGETQKPVIILLHGFVASKEYWQNVIPLLHRHGHGVVCVDLVGFGKARRAHTDEYTFETMTEYIDSLLSEIHITKPVILVGHSMGALLSAYYARKHPDKVKKLIMLNPPFYLNSEQATTTLHSTGKVYRFLLEGKGRGLLWGLLKLLPNNIRNHSSLAREQALQNIILNDGNFNMITNPSVDSLLVIGKHDRPVYLQNLKNIHPSDKLQVTVVDTNHHAPRTKPELTTRLILGLHQS